MTEQPIDPRQLEQTRFRIDTTINIAHILTTIAMVLAIFSWGSELKATVQKHEFEIADVKTNLRYDREGLREELRELNRKIDKISERVGAQQQK